MQTFAWQGQGYRDKQSMIFLTRGKRRPWQQQNFQKDLIGKGCKMYLTFLDHYKNFRLQNVLK